MPIQLRVLGCHGGETRNHRTSAFVVEERLAIDAGSITNMLTLEEQQKLQAVLVSHAHMDHVRDLATLADNRCQQDGPPLTIAATQATIDVLQNHFFNGRLWPDFTQIQTSKGPTVIFQALQAEQQSEVAGLKVRPIPVHHTVDTSAFIVENEHAALAYSGDTGPTDRLWELLSEHKKLRALIMEVSFPNDREELARVSGHHTPNTLAADLKKLKNHNALPILLFHIKPVFQRAVEREVAQLPRSELHVLNLHDHFYL